MTQRAAAVTTQKIEDANAWGRGNSINKVYAIGGSIIAMKDCFFRSAAWFVAVGSLAWATGAEPVYGAEPPRGNAPLRIGIIGLDTSHVIAFTTLINKDPLPEAAGCRVTAAYPQGSPDIESSVSRVPMYVKQVGEMGVAIVPSIDALLEQVDAVLLETNDGRPHLEQALPVLRAKKRMFIDKPMAGSLTDVIAIFDAAEHFQTPIFSTSSLRYGKGTLAVGQGAVGKVLACDAYGSCSLEKTHPDLYWYGIHGVEALFTVMGVGCESVARSTTADQELAVGVWRGGRIGTYRGMRAGAQKFGGVAFGETGNLEVGTNEGYAPLVIDILKFFRGGDPPVGREETIEVFAFMDGADESKRLGGKPVALADVIRRADAAAKEKSHLWLPGRSAASAR